MDTGAPDADIDCQPMGAHTVATLPQLCSSTPECVAFNVYRRDNDVLSYCLFRGAFNLQPRSGSWMREACQGLFVRTLSESNANGTCPRQGHACCSPARIACGWGVDGCALCLPARVRSNASPPPLSSHRTPSCRTWPLKSRSPHA